MPEGKEERIKKLGELYEQSDPTANETKVIKDLHKATGVSERSLWKYKDLYKWKRAVIDTPKVQKTVTGSKDPLPGLTEMERKAKAFLGRTRADLEWQAHYPEKGVEISDQEKLNWIKRIGKEFFLTGTDPFHICQNRGVDYSDFVEWISENQNCKAVWKAFSIQRTNYIVDFMTAYCFDVVKDGVMGTLPPIESVSITSMFVNGVYLPKSKTETRTTAPRPNPVQVIEVMTKITDWAEKQRRNASNQLTDSKALKSLEDIQERITELTNQLSGNDSRGIEGGPVE